MLFLFICAFALVGGMGLGALLLVLLAAEANAGGRDIAWLRPLIVCVNRASA